MPDTIRQIQLEYYDKLKELVDSRRYDTRDDFTVVLQPHMRDQYPLVDVRNLIINIVVIPVQPLIGFKHISKQLDIFCLPMALMCNFCISRLTVCHDISREKPEDMITPTSHPIASIRAEKDTRTWHSSYGMSW